MNLKSLNILFLITLILSVILLPMLLGASIIDFSEEDNFADQDDLLIISHFAATWIRIPVYQMSALLAFAISIFALFVVYAGGRSRHRRFNDRTIDFINVLTATLLKTAPFRAVFNFLSIVLHPFNDNDRLIPVFHPIFIPNKRSTKL
jgi:hypothetical protein